MAWISGSNRSRVRRSTNWAVVSKSPLALLRNSDGPPVVRRKVVPSNAVATLSFRQLGSAITFCSMYKVWRGNYPAKMCAIRTQGLPRRVVNSLLTVPELYHTMPQYPHPALLTIWELGRNQSRAMGRAMECDREAVVQIDIRDPMLK